MKNAESKKTEAPKMRKFKNERKENTRESSRI